MKTIVSKELCIGCELCAGLAPDLYKMEDDGKAVAIKESITPEEHEEAKEAVDSCPTEAISIS